MCRGASERRVAPALARQQPAAPQDPVQEAEVAGDAVVDDAHGGRDLHAACRESLRHLAQDCKALGLCQAAFAMRI